MLAAACSCCGVRRVPTAESGEELFEVRVDPPSGDVIYKIRAISWAQSPLAWIGQPIVRLLQARFRKDSAAAMQRAAT